ncbi:3-deoxy-manno-octulosonate-8-phosphatase KdsC [Celerinatantimonas yamalensis]|uniref:3-deoxy-D-manno-octulosonate 8-phosphate phosphatase KdsC n=1 Tax=Celerinatantimonas yamalensis TaxID=559956 RepID=A0ABW9GE23_9GAMM
MSESFITTLYGDISPTVFAKATQTQLLICDVDGVFSDGRIYLGNAGEELKAFHTRDGFGIKALARHQIGVAIITGRQSQLVENRMHQLEVAYIYQGQHNKLDALAQLLQRTGLTAEQCAYIGDDVVDLNVMRQVGLSIAVHDAHPKVTHAADYTTHLPGGFGAVREVCDLLLQAHGIDDYTQGASL